MKKKGKCRNLCRRKALILRRITQVLRQKPEQSRGVKEKTLGTFLHPTPRPLRFIHYISLPMSLPPASPGCYSVASIT